MSAKAPRLSIVVIAYDMAAQLERTLRSLSPALQRGVEGRDYEVIVVDNGSPEPLSLEGFDGYGSGQLREDRIEDAPPSPARAINRGIELSRGEVIGVMIDGARLATPGVVRLALAGAELAPRAVVVTLGFHLGPDLQTRTVRQGYDEEAEHALLESVSWEEDPYRLFEISVPAASSNRGWFATPAESNALFLPTDLWKELEGFDERFAAPGGGLVNLDTFKRACELPGAQPVILLGEGTFHQVHGGIATNAPTSPFSGFHDEYQELRGEKFRRPDIKPLYLGHLPDFAAAAMSHGIGSSSTAQPGDAGDRYLNLLKQALLNEPGLEAETAFFALRDATEDEGGEEDEGELIDDDLLYDVRLNLAEHFGELAEARAVGRYYRGEPRNIGFGYSMIGQARLDSLEDCVSRALEEGVEGDLVECGVWRGGAAILMRAILAERGDAARCVWLADSFAGLPAPSAPEDTYDLSAGQRPELAVPLERVKYNFELFGLLDERVRFLPGWFSETLPKAPIESIAVLRLDGDMYSSTRESLEALYDRVSPGGFVIIDDYGVVTGCRKAVDEFRARRGIDAELIEVDHTCVFWRVDPPRET